MHQRTREPFRVEFGIVVCAILRILERDMDDTAHQLLRESGAERHFPKQQTAEVAARIATLCRRLTAQIRNNYQSTLWPEDEQENPDDDIPF